MVIFSIHPFVDVQKELGKFAVGEDEVWITKHSVFEEVDNPCTKVVVARDAGKMIGYALITNKSMCYAKSDCLYHVCVGKEYRRKGVCRSLMENAQKECDSLWGVCDEGVKYVWERLGAKIERRKEGSFCSEYEIFFEK